ncbi:TrlF family AAA-like ATPase [Syntrophus aciditrophicus]|uniref:ATPases involved in DNA repair n=1 Tax=Syntrophus aciditrophicus (strain SB) TaxID=56780 RepID=Q2LRR6_SYNAS|nr:AAA family ATPase [Syntrophus aciditrophicus]ABC76780.1 ATPases involved in DNA repair [Syntrophus aciditrophicus SB]
MSKARYARFWKCALQVNPWDYARKYRGRDHGLDESEYNNQILQTCQSEDIHVVGIADHGSVDTLDGLRQVLVNGGIVVFPGFEIASAEKAHFVCLFSENTTIQQLERYLGSLKLTDPDDGVHPSSLSAEQLLWEIEQLGGIAYAAHCTEKSGVLQRKLDHVWKNSLLLAAQVPGSLDDLKNDEGNAYRIILRNKNRDYQRERPIGIINAKDVAEPKDLQLPQACCLVRMTEPCFDAFRQAFLDPESRVRLLSDRQERFFSQLERVRFTGGYLPGVDIQLSGHLNAIIGGRGTGKTTLLECIRYAMEQEPISERAKRTHREIVKQNLGAGRVEIDIRSFTMQGRRFTISRRYGEAAIVRDESGNTSTFRPADLLPRLEIFGQNEIFDIAQDEGGLTSLLRRFLSSKDATDRRRIEIQDKLRGNAKRLVDARSKLAEIEDQVARLPKLEEQARQFQTIGLGEKLAIVPKLEKERQLAARIEEEQRNVQEALVSLEDALPDATFLGEEVVKGLPHVQEIRKLRSNLTTLHSELETLIANAKQKVEVSDTEIKAKITALSAKITGEEATLEQEFAKIPAFQGRTGREIGSAYQQVLKDIERIRPLKTKRDTRQMLVTELRKERNNLLANLSEAIANAAAEIDVELKILRKKLEGKLRPSVDHAANRRELKDFIMKCNLEGVGEARLRWLDDAEEFSPIRLAQTIRQGAEALKNAGWGMTAGVAEALTKLSESKLLEIEAMVLPDIIRLELNVAHIGKEEYRPISKLSTGQQCTAVLHLLLLENRDPLIVDQPEDNLDNAFIAERIVTELRSAKLGRQFIFATHNANIPVFGDAEWIGVLQASEGQANMPDEFQGAVDVPEIRSQAAAILEGGKEAFIQRKEKYGF